MRLARPTFWLALSKSDLFFPGHVKSRGRGTSSAYFPSSSCVSRYPLAGEDCERGMSGPNQQLRSKLKHFHHIVEIS